MTKPDAIEILTQNPALVLQHFGITKEEYLDALTDKDIQARREESGWLYAELSLVRLPHAEQLLGIPAKRIKREIPVTNWGNRNQKVSHAALYDLIKKHTTTPPNETD